MEPARAAPGGRTHYAETRVDPHRHRAGAGRRSGPARQPHRRPASGRPRARRLRRARRGRADARGPRPWPRRRPPHDPRRRGAPVRPAADARGLVPGGVARRRGRGRRLRGRHPRRHARSVEGARRPGRRARARRRPVPAGRPVPRLPRQPSPARPLRRELGEQGLRRRLDRPHRQHLCRSGGVREHALQPAPRPAVRGRRDGPTLGIGRGLLERAGRCFACRDHRVLDGRVRVGERPRCRLHRGRHALRPRAAQRPPGRAAGGQRSVRGQRRSEDPCGDRDRAVGHAVGLLGRRGAGGDRGAGLVHGRQRGRRLGLRERHARHLRGRRQRPSVPC